MQLTLFLRCKTIHVPTPLFFDETSTKCSKNRDFIEKTTLKAASERRPESILPGLCESMTIHPYTFSLFFKLILPLEPQALPP